jgi:mannose-6-phosphate isomerase-like protein (cupin superfamily)
MPPDKHLVLDSDVHDQLKSRKVKRGATLREIGNTILRSALTRPALSEAIARELISKGKISPADYAQARDAVIRKEAALHRPITEILALTDRKTFLSGSWEISPLPLGETGAYHAFEAWAIDDKKRPLSLHCHAKSDQYFIVIQDRILVALDEGERILKEGEMYRVPAGQPHAVTPLSASSRFVAVCRPPDPGFVIEDG